MKIEINGHELEVVASNERMIRFYLEKLGWLSYADDRDGLLNKYNNMSLKDQVKTNEIMQGFFNHCAGWCVTNNPTQDDVALLEAMGMNSGLEKVQRANWVRHILFDKDEHDTALLASVLELSLKKQQEENSED